MVIQTKSEMKTRHLALKPYSLSDVDGLARLLTEPKITDTFMVPNFETYDEVLALAKKLVFFSQPEDASHLEYGIYLDNQLIGFVNDCGMEGDEIEIGYVIHPDYWGHGYATEAATAVIQELREMGFRKVTAGFLEGNDASRRVLEKCGMHPCDGCEVEEYRGILRKCFYYEICF